MRIRPWVATTTLVLVASAVATIGLDGCSDDGTGTIPGSLYSSYSNGEGGSAEDPGVSTQTTPPGSSPIDATVDVQKDAKKPTVVDAAGDADGNTADAGDAGDSG
jgi:hypothetical protein